MKFYNSKSLMASLALFGTTASLWAANFTAMWDFAKMNPTSLSNVYFQGSEGHISSSKSGVQIFAIAKNGKFDVRTADAQMNANTYLRIPVYKVGDQVIITTHVGYHNYVIGSKTANADKFTYTATADDVKNGWVQMEAKATIYLLSIQLNSDDASSSSAGVAVKATATWDFSQMNPSSLKTVQIEGAKGKVASNLDGIQLFVLGQYGKFAARTNDVQFNEKTTVRVPVTKKGDVVTVTSAANYHNYAIGGIHADNDVMTYQATDADAKQGYVVLYSYGQTYLKSINVNLQAYVKPSTNSGSTSSNTQNNGSYEDNTTATTVPVTNIKNFIIVKHGDVNSLLSAISKANSANASVSAGRYYIYVPAGTYNLGSRTLTAITGHNISIIGDGMDKTIIKNSPAVSQEGISTTATLLNRGQNTYLQDLTLQNALDYYNAGSAGRAVALQDKGNRTIAKNVRMLSYQDTYYSNGKGQYYFEGGDIHGTVDFICGGGDVFFNKTTITVEKRTKGGSGSCIITAPYTDAANKGYVFNSCTIKNYAESYSLGRGWGGKPRLAFINTKMNDTRIAKSRFSTAGMNTVADKFVEYNSMDASGKQISPSSNVLTFTKGSESKKMETIISSADAKQYSLSKVFTDWQPNNLTAQISVSGVVANGQTISWKKGNASAYAIYKDGSLVTMVDANTTSYKASGSGTYTIKAANSMGGLGSGQNIKVTVSSSDSSTSSGSQGSTSSSSQVSGLSKYDLNQPIGWSNVGGKVTGSEDKNPVLVSTMSQFLEAMKGTEQRTIYVSGTLTTNAQVYVQNAANKTVYGLPGSALSNTTHTSNANNTGVLCIKNCKNIILRNLTFKGPGAYDIDGKDNLTMQKSTYVWVDHCDFQDGCDGNFDINTASDNISITWCRFRYLITPWSGGSGGSNDHRFSDLIGGSDKATGDEGKLKITFANCWWDEGCKERLPRVRYGKIHILNCLYSSSNVGYCIGAGYKSNIYVENSVYATAATQKKPWDCKTSGSYKDYNITLKGCEGTADAQSKSGNNEYFVPAKYYTYKANNASEVKSYVSAAAGATLKVSYGAGVSKSRSVSLGDTDGQTTGICDFTEAAKSVLSTRIFTLKGNEVQTLQPGLNIVKTTYSDGHTDVKKVLKK